MKSVFVKLQEVAPSYHSAYDLVYGECDESMTFVDMLNEMVDYYGESCCDAFKDLLSDYVGQYILDRGIRLEDDESWDW